MKIEDSDYELTHIDYDNLSPPKTVITRSSEVTECECSLCFTGRLNGRDYTDYKEMMSHPVGRPSVSSGGEVEQGPVVVCAQCLSEYRRGISHHCTKSNLQDNAVNLGNYCNMLFGNMLFSQNFY